MTVPPLLLFSTRNRGKLAEVRAILAAVPARIVGVAELVAEPATRRIPPVPEVEETGETLEENALLKARTAFRITGIPAIADDTGLEVEYLGGAPGVRSARYAGAGATYDDNNRKLLAELSGVRARAARFRCVAAFAGPGLERWVEGRCDGRIAEAPRGREGFGYDPIFIPDGGERSFADLSPAEKNRISHRAAAFRALADFLASL